LQTRVKTLNRKPGTVFKFAPRQRRFPLGADLGQQPKHTNDRAAERDRHYPRVTLEEMADFMPFTNVPAVRDRRVHLIGGKLVSWYGPHIGRSLRAFRALLRGQESGAPRGVFVTPRKFHYTGTWNDSEIKQRGCQF
jgi:hypothetical protein